MSTTAQIIAFLDALHALPPALRPAPTTTWLGCETDLEPVIRAWVAAHDEYQIYVGSAGNVEIEHIESHDVLVAYYRRTVLKEAA